MSTVPHSLMDREKMILCVCGLAGSGKSTVAKRLARHYKLKYLSGGDALKAVAADMGYKVTCKGWWESEEGRRFIEERERNLEIDRKVDEKLLKWARKGGVVLDSWAIPWLVKEGFKVWLEASENERARRVAQRDDLSLEDAVRFIREKEEKTKAIYKKLYGFNLGEDFTPFNLIIDVENLDKDEVYQALRMVIDNLVLKEKHS